MALLQYIQDYDSMYPHCSIAGDNRLSAGWPGWIANPLQPYMKSHALFRCPSKSPSASGGWSNPWDNNAKSWYAWNYMIGYNRAEADLANGPAGVASMILMWDANNPWADSVTFIQDRYITPFKNGDTIANCWHMSNNNFLYADGHVKAGNWGQVNWEQVLLIPQTDPHYGVKSVVPY